MSTAGSDSAMHTPLHRGPVHPFKFVVGKWIARFKDPVTRIVLLVSGGEMWAPVIDVARRRRKRERETASRVRGAGSFSPSSLPSAFSTPDC